MVKLLLRPRGNGEVRMANIQPRSNGGEQESQQPPQGAQGQMTTRNQEPSFLTPRDFFSTSPFAMMRRMSEEMDRIFSGLVPNSEGREGFGWAPAIEVC